MIHLTCWAVNRVKNDQSHYVS